MSRRIIFCLYNLVIKISYPIFIFSSSYLIETVSTSCIFILLRIFPLFCLTYYSSLSTIAKKRPAFYGRILPVLLGFNPSSSVINGMHISGAHHALKNAFLTCLKCTHPGAAPVLFHTTLNLYIMSFMLWLVKSYICY